MIKEAISCKECGELAQINLQKTWVVYEIDSDTGKYSDGVVNPSIEEPIGDHNIHLCKECFDQDEW